MTMDFDNRLVFGSKEANRVVRRIRTAEREAGTTVDDILAPFDIERALTVFFTSVGMRPFFSIADYGWRLVSYERLSDDLPGMFAVERSSE